MCLGPRQAFGVSGALLSHLQMPTVDGTKRALNRKSSTCVESQFSVAMSMGLGISSPSLHQESGGWEVDYLAWRGDPFPSPFSSPLLVLFSFFFSSLWL